MFGFLDFWVFGFSDFWKSCVLHLCFQSVETFGKTAFVSVFTVLLRGVRVVGAGGAGHIYIYIYATPPQLSTIFVP